MAENHTGAPRPLIEIPQWMNAASSVFVIVLGGVYVVGLLIINIDLGRNGLISLDLGRPEYVLAGALWAFLTIGMLGVGMLLSEAVPECRLALKEKSWPKRLLGVLRPVVIIFGAFYFFDLALNLLSRSQVSFWFHGRSAWRITLATYGVIGWNSWMVYSIFKVVENFGRMGHSLSPKTLFSIVYRDVSPFQSFVYLLAGLSGYALAAYPVFAKEFGGGKKPTVELYLSTEPFKANKLHLPVDKSDESIGPVVLIFESEAMFFIRPLRKDESGWGPWFATESDTTTGIAKELVQALTYVRAEKDHPPPSVRETRIEPAGQKAEDSNAQTAKPEPITEVNKIPPTRK